MKGWPRTLLGRNLLLVAALVVVGQLVAAWLVIALQIRPRLESTADGAARTILSLRAGLAALPAAERGAFVQAFNQRAGGAPALEDAEPPGAQALGRFNRALVRAVSRRIASEQADILWRRAGGGSLALRLTVDGTDHWVTLPGLLPAREFTGAWLAASLLAVLLALLVAWAVQRRLHRPLADLAEAARALGHGGQPAPLAEGGAREIAAVASQFNQMVRGLREADRQRALMLAGISHDVRTPLTTLRLGVEILAGDSADAALAGRMRRAMGDLDGIVGQFLDAAREGAHDAAVPTDLGALAAAVADASAARGQPCALALQPAPVRPRHADLLRRALVNLVENAWRHGRPPVTLRVGHGGGASWLEVEDRGPGIPAAEREQLRQPFARGEAARSGTRGAGLGLTIVERAARAHGGHLVLDEATGGGLRARIVLPDAAD